MKEKVIKMVRKAPQLEKLDSFRMRVRVRKWREVFKRMRFENFDINTPRQCRRFNSKRLCCMLRNSTELAEDVGREEVEHDGATCGTQVVKELQ